MAKDPAFLFYSGDFFTGVATLTFEERGKFISILCLMHQQGRMSEETIRLIVGSVSVNLKNKFKVDEKGLWYNERLELEAARRNNFVESRVINGKSGGRPKANAKPKRNHKVNHTANRMEDENRNENESINEAEFENYVAWTNQILDRACNIFQVQMMNERIPESPNIDFWVRDHLGLLERYPKMRPQNQQRFVGSVMKHIRENYKKPINGNGFNKNQQHTNGLIQDFKRRHGTTDPSP